MSARRLQRLKSVLEKRQPDLTVIMENVHKPHNLAAVLRTCDAVGVPRVHAVSADSRIRASVSAAQGTHRWVPVTTHARLADAIEAAHGQTMQIVAAHPATGAVDYREVDYTRPTAILLGAELDGVSEQALAAADHQVIIPMHGMATSLNVSVAAALMLFEAERQRHQAGMYAGPRLDNALMERMLFEWLQPRMARYCRKHGLAYPALDEDGDLRHHPEGRAVTR